MLLLHNYKPSSVPFKKYLAIAVLLAIHIGHAGYCRVNGAGGGIFILRKNRILMRELKIPKNLQKIISSYDYFLFFF